MNTPRCEHCGQSTAVVISIAEAAERLGIAKRVAYELVAAGRLPHVRLNGRSHGRLVVHWPTVEEWLHNEALESVRPEGRRPPLRQVGA